MKGQNAIVCPQCGGNKVRNIDLTPILFVAAIAISWIPIFGWIGAPILIVLGVINIFKKHKKFTCQECKQAFNVSKEKYLEYKSQIKKVVS